MKTILLVTAAAVAALVAGAARPEPAAGTAAADRAGGITVTGSGAVVAVPDRAELSFGVESRGASARAALAANSAQMQKVVAALRAAGIAAADIRTQHVSISPRTTGDEGGEIAGYVASNAVGVRIRSLDRVAAVIDAAVAAGANQVYGPSLSRSNAAELYRTALARAVDDARAKAEALAEASGLPLGDVTAVVEAGGGGPMPAADLAEEARASAPIEPGTEEIRATVTVTFAAG